MRVNKSLKTTLYSNLTVKFVNSASVKVFSKKKILDNNNERVPRQNLDANNGKVPRQTLDATDGRVPRWITGFYFHNPIHSFSSNCFHRTKTTPQVTQGELLL